MKYLAKPLLWIMTTAIPVFIAACYGAVDQYLDEGPEKSIAGRVLSAMTGGPIPYIKVSCMVYGYDGLESYDDTLSAAEDGGFELWALEASPCDMIRFEDIDGVENGQYAPLDVEYVDDGSLVVAQLEAEE